MDGDSLYKIIDGWRGTQLYQNMLDGERYYRCKNDILSRKFYYYQLGVKTVDDFRSNVRIPNDFLKIIIDQKVSYCLAKDVIIEGAETPFDVNDEIDFVAEESSQKSVGWAFVWIDENGEMKQKSMKSETIIPLFDGSIENRLTGLVRTYQLDKVEYAEFWDNQFKQTYMKDGPKYILTEETTHLNNNESWGKIPFIPLYNNLYEMTDLDNLKALIDAYDQNISDFSNNFIDFQEIFYKLKNYAESLKDEQAISELLDFFKKYKIVNVADNGDFEILTTEIPSIARGEFLETLRKLIFLFGHAVDTEKLSGGSLTNVTIQAYFTNLDQKANKFLKMCKRYIKELLYFSNKYKEFKGIRPDDLTQVKITFNKSQIINDVETVDMLIASMPLLSKETLIENHPLIDDPEKELERLKNEEAETVNNMMQFNNQNLNLSGSGGNFDGQQNNI